MFDWRLRFSVRDSAIAPGIALRGGGAELMPYLVLLNEVLARHERSAEIPLLLAALAQRFLALPAPGAPAARGLDPALRRRVQRWIQTGLDVRITPRELARRAGLGLDHFTRLFRASYGVPPRRYLMEERMRRAAAKLAESDISVARLCAQLDEHDQGTFCRQFERVMGCTPSTYRRRS